MDYNEKLQREVYSEEEIRGGKDVEQTYLNYILQLVKKNK